jgi:hypothetical protein
MGKTVRRFQSCRGPYGLGAAITDSDGTLIVMERGQNVGYQSYLILIPGEGQGMVVMTNSDNGFDPRRGAHPQGS